MGPGGWERAFIDRQRVARLATIDPQGWPHLVPIVFAVEDRRLYTPIDNKPKRVKPHQLQRVHNIQADPRVAVLFDEYSEDWRRLAWVKISGLAEFVESGNELDTSIALLEARYPQYADRSLRGQPIIVITIERITSWRASDRRES